jgi:hypothetical protein
MFKNILGVILLLTLFIINNESLVYAQYIEGKHYAGPSIGLSFLGSTFQIGGNYEYAMNVQDFGMIGVGGILRYWGYSETFNLGKWKYTNILIGGQGNYHFKIKDYEHLDPYAGLVLAYDGGSVSYSGPERNYPEPSHGGLWFGVQGGIRYWFNPNISATARVSFGTLSYGALELGVDLKF